MAASAAPQRRMSALSRRQQILDVAWEIAVREGLPAINMDVLASQAGITRALIYQQFGNLSAVLVALIDREYNKALDRFMRAVAQHPETSANQFTAITQALLDAVDDDPQAWRIFLKPPAGGPPELHQRLTEGLTLTRQILEQGLRVAVDAGSIRDRQLDVELCIRCLQISVEELLRLRLENPQRYPHERLLAQIRLMSQPIFGPE